MIKLFISYRRSDSQDFTGRLYESLIARYSRHDVYKDIDSIPLGIDFKKHIAASLSLADVVLVIIGPTWLSVADSAGKRRLASRDDFVRLEIEVAMQLGKKVIPITASNARMPKSSELPRSIKRLAHLNGIPIRPDPDYANDFQRLISRLEREIVSDNITATAHNDKSNIYEELTEYIFLDLPRLDSYIDQIDYESASYQISPVDMPESNPRRDINNRSDAKKNIHEKIACLKTHLIKTDQIIILDDSRVYKPENFLALGNRSILSAAGTEKEADKDRIRASYDDWHRLLVASFHSVECEAIRIHIPAKKGATNFAGITMWITTEQWKPIPIYLFEDYVVPTEDRYSTGRGSKFTQWTYLIQNLFSDYAFEFSNVGELWSAFHSDNILKSLAHSGATIGMARRIQALYKVREFVEATSGLVICGYPIAISEKARSFRDRLLMS